MKLRKFFFKTLLALLSLSIILLIYVWRIEPRWVEWNYITMPIKNIPDTLIGKNIVQISDIHIGEQVEENYIIKEFEKINQTTPDIVIYTGDFISSSPIDQAPYDQLEKVLKHAARGKLATLAILGNHDYGILARNGSRADSVANLLKEYKITLLRNEKVNILGLNIIGIDDYWGNNFYPNHALKLYNKQDANLILCHNPDVCDLDIWKDYDGWILSGHTHGGQVRFPFRHATRLPVENKNYDEGLKHLSDGRTLYINKGLGHAIRVRFNVRPEIAFFTLKNKA